MPIERKGQPLPLKRPDGPAESAIKWRDLDLVTFCLHPILGLGPVRSQTMRQFTDLAHTLSTNCYQPADGIGCGGAANEF